MNNLPQYDVLVVEDDPITSNVLQFALTRGGFTVLAAPNGEEALALLAERSVSLVITDHQMPRMCGIDFCRHLRQDARFVDLPIFLCSAKGLELDSELQQLELQISQVFFKPFSPRAIVQAVRTQLTPDPAAN